MSTSKRHVSIVNFAFKMHASHNRSLSQICQFRHGICNDGTILFQRKLSDALERTLIFNGSDCAYHLPLISFTNQFFPVQYDNDMLCTIA